MEEYRLVIMSDDGDKTLVKWFGEDDEEIMLMLYKGQNFDPVLGYVPTPLGSNNNIRLKPGAGIRLEIIDG